MDAADTGATVPASYYDGKTSRRHAVGLAVRDGVAYIEGEAERHCALAQLHVSERSAHAARKVTFPDGAYLEVEDHAAFALLLQRTGHRDSWVVRLQQSWRGALSAVAATAAVLLVAYIYVLPAAADGVARALPESAERRLGDGLLELLDRQIFRPTALPAERRAALDAAFARLAPPQSGAPRHRIVFRQSRIGPNAFALPSGDIVMTDQMVALLPDDAAVMGVLAHELGHLHERHLTRRLIQSSALAAIGAALFGDVSAVVAGLPALMADLKFSRDAEREADDYAIAMLQHNDIPLEHLVQVFSAMAKLDQDPAPYLSSHPVSAERIERVRAAQR